MKTKLLLGASLGVCALAWAAKDPVIMKVNGVDVPKSEFEYLYHKNSQQQVAPQPLDEYVEMFVNYRLKVADALAEGIDTTSAFRQEMAQYRHDLAAPYMADSVFLNNLVREAYDRSREEVETSHIMFFKNPRVPGANRQAKASADSLRRVIAEEHGDFTTLAAQYSQDRGSNHRGGNLGYIRAGYYPYGFEKAVFDLKPGEVSQVVESPSGYHIIKVGGRRPARGQVRAAHILLFDNNPAATPEEKEAVKARIDSIYNVVSSDPSKFEELARALSDDKGSGRQGGMLPWFGSGQMVAEFDSVAFAMPVGEISAPFRTDYGWHIIRKIDAKGAPSLAEMKPGELARIGNPQDERYELVRKHRNEQLSRKHKPHLNSVLTGELLAYAGANGIDSLFYEKYSVPAEASRELLRIGKKSYPLSEFTASLNGVRNSDPDQAVAVFERGFDIFTGKRLTEVEEEWLEENEPDYRNLLHEYTNGSLLYEASVKNVWNKASNDTEGLEDYFAAHRADYTWSEPRAKGILVQAKNDSIAADVVRRYMELPKIDAIPTLKKEYKGEATIDRVLMPKGQNPVVDWLMFGAPQASSSNAGFDSALMIEGKVIDAPEEVADVRGQVTGDYQEYLEEAWVKSLREKYPVEIYRKVLKKVK
ncbi:MAG: hypothetical protein HDR80_06345 [Bacteroides sp.]|nr:hypothetical protein [Bacteroides sp.]